MYKVTNLIGGQLVCTLHSGKTLRIDANMFAEIHEDDMTPYLKTIEEKGLIKIEGVAEAKTFAEVTPKKSTHKSESKKEE